MVVLSTPLVLLQSIPPVTRAFSFATAVSTSLYAYLTWKGFEADASYYMTVVPGTAIYAPWTLFTSALVEISIFEVSNASTPTEFRSRNHRAVYRDTSLCSSITKILGAGLGKPRNS